MSENTNTSLTLKPTEAAKLLNVSKPVIYELCKRKDFPAIRVGRAIIIPRAQLDTWLEKESQRERV